MLLRMPSAGLPLLLPLVLRGSHNYFELPLLCRRELPLLSLLAYLVSGNVSLLPHLLLTSVSKIIQYLGLYSVTGLRSATQDYTVIYRITQCSVLPNACE